MKAKIALIALTCATLVLTTQAAMAQNTEPTNGFNPQSPWTIELETGPAWFKRNNVRIPNDTGTRFDMLKLTGNGPDAFIRLYATYEFNERHALRLNIAPLELSGNGTLPNPVRFQDTDFAAGADTRGRYKFNNYRLTYRWMYHRSESWDLGLGGADNDSLYTFAWLHYATFGIGMRF